MFCDPDTVSIFEIIGIVVIVPIVDWIAITGMAARLTDFDYRYWPPTKSRVVGVGCLALAVGVVAVFANPDNPPLWPLIPVGLLAFAWIGIGYLDIVAQRRTGYRVPPSYGERE